MKTIKHLSLLISLFLFQHCNSGNRNGISKDVNPDIRTLTIHSNVLDEDREISIYIPPRYNSKKIKYPVIYVFDGESLFLSTVAAVDFMNYSYHFPLIPESIVVGIKNTDRMRDMPRPQEIKNNNGASTFLNFLSGEVVPFLTKNYAVNGLNILIGHSQGGLFVTYAGLQKPDLYQVILALDAPMQLNPSLQTEYAQLLSGCKLHYFSGETMLGWGNAFPGVKCPGMMQMKLENETHESMAYKGIYEGLKFLFKDHVPLQKDLSLKALKEYYGRLSKIYGHEYFIPAGFLLHSATEKISTSDKQGAIELLEYYKRIYGADKSLSELMPKAMAITRSPEIKVNYYLNHPPADQAALQPFFGQWKGVLKADKNAPGSIDVGIDWEIKKEGVNYVKVDRVMKQFDIRSEFLFVSEKNELIWGRKHAGGGIYLSISQLSRDRNEITGYEQIFGYEFPKEIAPYRAEFKFKKVK